WSETGSDGLGRVRFARLDVTAHLTGSVRVMPPLDDQMSAFRPAIAETPGGYLAAWIESAFGVYHVVVCPLDRSLVPLRDPSLLGVRPGVLLASNGDLIMAALSEGLLIQVDATGRFITSFVVSESTTDLIVTPDHTFTLGQWSVSFGGWCRYGP